MNTPPLLPSDRYLASLLGLTEEEYRWFRAEVRSRVKIEPGKPQAGLDPISIIVIAVTLISVGLTIAASFFKPRDQGQGPQIRSKNKQGDDINTNVRFAPRRGFDSVQDPAVLGTTIPVVYARRRNMAAQTETVSGGMVIPARPAGQYGGLRVNTPLIWSQLWSVNGNQLLRAIFLISEGAISSLDLQGFAIGDTSLTGYELDALDNQFARLSIYLSKDSGRLVNADHIAGCGATYDIANATNGGGQDVFALKSVGNAYRQDFCFTSRPSANTTFGLYSHIPNNFSFRVNPRVRPTLILKTKPKNDGEDFKVDCDDDAQALSDTWKSKYHWSSRSGLVGGSSGTVTAGAELIYHLSDKTDSKKRIVFNDDNTDNESRDANGSAKCGDVGLGVSARQRSADDALEIGELYKIGSAIAVLTARSGNDAFTDPDKVFISQADSTNEEEGQGMYYKFTVVKGGYVGPLYSKTDDLDYNHDAHAGDTPNKLKPPRWRKPGLNELSAISSLKKFNTATKAPQIFRCAISNVVTPRACQVFELGFKSQVGIRVNGFSNLRDSPTLRKVNYDAGYKFQGNTYDSDTRLGVAIYQSGSIQTAEERYSFFKIYYREYNGTFTEIPGSFGIRSVSSQPLYNYLRMSMPNVKRWELRFEPLSGFEVRNGYAAEPLIILDGRLKTEVQYVFPGGITVYWTGQIVARYRSVFRFRALEPDDDIGYNFTDDEDMTDDWGKLAEAFAYDEIQSSTTNGPEHEVVYINTITQNADSCTANYANIAILGLNIRASTEWQQFSQFSVYVTEGIAIRRIIGSNVGPSDLFPDILRDLLTSDRYGTGAAVSDEQIDTDSFLRAATWCRDRRYFFNGSITQKVNLRQWAADTAAGMLLELVQRDGKWGLEPAVIFGGSGTTGKVPIKALFTSGNIVEGSFQMEFLEEQDRQPIQASVKWREERARETYTSNGLFPVEREVLVRESYRPDTDPIESFDLSDYCTSLEHAIDFACYVIRVRNLITHSIKFSTTPDGILTPLAAGDYIQVAMDMTYYDEYANGVVLETGELITTRPDLLPAGSHAVVSWAGGQEEVQDTTLTVNANGTASPTGILFLKKTSTSHLRTYKVESISINPEGVISIEAVHHPTDTNLKSEITKNWTTYVSDVNWIIEDG